MGLSLGMDLDAIAAGNLAAATMADDDEDEIDAETEETANS